MTKGLQIISDATFHSAMMHYHHTGKVTGHSNFDLSRLIISLTSLLFISEYCAVGI